MRPSTTLLLLLLATVTFSSSSPTSQRQALHHHGSNSTGSRCLPHERDALLVFKHGITGDPAGRLASWREGVEEDCCQWKGVQCSSQTGHVVAIRLRNEDPEASRSCPRIPGAFKELEISQPL
nr:unnamed protein product [Digitaria exilis]